MAETRQLPTRTFFRGHGMLLGSYKSDSMLISIYIMPVTELGVTRQPRVGRFLNIPGVIHFSLLIMQRKGIIIGRITGNKRVACVYLNRSPRTRRLFSQVWNSMQLDKYPSRCLPVYRIGPAHLYRRWHEECSPQHIHCS